jgi:hypothetical protein
MGGDYELALYTTGAYIDLKDKIRNSPEIHFTTNY